MLRLSGVRGECPADPLFPGSALLPLCDADGVKFAVEHVAGALRPFAATLAVRTPDDLRHHTTSTRNTTSNRTEQSDDGRVRSDSVTDTTTDS